MLFGCTIARQLLDMVGVSCPPNGFSLSSVERNISFLLDVMGNEELPKQSREMISWSLWTVWKNRNATIITGRRDDLVR